MDVNVRLESANRVGRTSLPARPRTVVARFGNFTDRQKCLKSSSKLRGTDIFLYEDVSKATVEEKKAELDNYRKQGLIAYFSGIRIITRQRPTFGASTHQGAATGANTEPLHGGLSDDQRTTNRRSKRMKLKNRHIRCLSTVHCMC